MSFDMMGNFLQPGDYVASPTGAELRIGRVKTIGKKMVVLEPVEGHPKSITEWEGAKRYFHNVLKVNF